MSRRWIICAHCGQAGRHHAQGQCSACYVYAWQHGRPRPRHLWTGERPPCVNCGQAIMPAQRRHGRCAACTAFWRRHGYERPADPAYRARLGLAPLPAIPWGRPKRPGYGWRWDGTGWRPPSTYCRQEQDYGQKPLCGRCGQREACGALALGQPYAVVGA